MCREGSALVERHSRCPRSLQRRVAPVLKCEEELFFKRADRAMLMVSHHDADIRRYCSRACVLERGELREFSTVEEAYDFYGRTQAHA